MVLHWGHQGGDDVYGDGEDDGAVVLSRDTVEGLEVSQLESCRVVSHHLRCVSQGSAGLVFPLGSDHFSSGLSGSLSLSSHGSLEILWNPDVLHLHPLHGDAPGLRGHFQAWLKATGGGRLTNSDWKWLVLSSDVVLGQRRWDRSYREDRSLSAADIFMTSLYRGGWFVTNVIHSQTLERSKQYISMLSSYILLDSLERCDGQYIAKLN